MTIDGNENINLDTKVKDNKDGMVQEMVQTAIHLMITITLIIIIQEINTDNPSDNTK